MSHPLDSSCDYQIIWMMGKFLQLGCTPESKMSRPVRICLVIWLLLSFFFFHKSGQSQQTSVNRPTERWALDFGAGCPVDPAVQTTNTNTEAKPARPLSAAELLCRPLPSDLSSVPKLLHQSWKTNEPLLKFEKWSTVCREKHRDWEWVLWTNEDNLNLVKKCFPWLRRPFWIC